MTDCGVNMLLSTHTLKFGQVRRDAQPIRQTFVVQTPEGPMELSLFLAPTPDGESIRAVVNCKNVKNYKFGKNLITFNLSYVFDIQH